jgi:3-dehydroquinate synthase
MHMKCFTQLIDYLNAYSPGRQIAVILDETVSHIYEDVAAQALNQAEITHTFITVPSGEAHKTLSSAQKIYEQLFEIPMKKGDVLVAIGGGVILDLSGFIAATYLRGLSLVFIPTTVLAMVDASIGGKNGVNTPFGKNTLGTMYTPSEVLIDIEFLKTLEEKDFISGFAEILKHALIADFKLFRLLLKTFEAGCLSLKELFLNSIEAESLIEVNRQIKREICSEDADNPELHLRDALNFGHTLGHALEVLTDFGISHGKAVLLGMAFEVHVSCERGYLPTEDGATILGLIQRIHPGITSELDSLLVDLQIAEMLDRLVSLMQQDKKSSSNCVPLILLGDIGRIHAPNPKDCCIHVAPEECRSYLVNFFDTKGAFA